MRPPRHRSTQLEVAELGLEPGEPHKPLIHREPTAPHLWSPHLARSHCPQCMVSAPFPECQVSGSI